MHIKVSVWQKPFLYLLLCAAAMLTACDKDGTEPRPGSTANETPAENRKLKINVNKVVSYTPYKEYGVGNAEVGLYRSETDREQVANVQRFAITSPDGYAELDHLKEDVYYMRVKHDTYGVIDVTIHTPKSAAVNFETVVYP